jgi:hypothetical protein
MKIAYIWTAFICLQLGGQFVIGVLRNIVEKKYARFMWKLSCAVTILLTGILVAACGIKGYLV